MEVAETQTVGLLVFLPRFLTLWKSFSADAFLFSVFMTKFQKEPAERILNGCTNHCFSVSIRQALNADMGQEQGLIPLSKTALLVCCPTKLCFHGNILRGGLISQHRSRTRPRHGSQVLTQLKIYQSMTRQLILHLAGNILVGESKIGRISEKYFRM